MSMMMIAFSSSSSALVETQGKAACKATYIMEEENEDERRNVE